MSITDSLNQNFITFLISVKTHTVLKLVLLILYFLGVNIIFSTIIQEVGMCGQTSFVPDVTELVVGLYEDVVGNVINVIRIYSLFCLKKN